MGGKSARRQMRFRFPEGAVDVRRAFRLYDCARTLFWHEAEPVADKQYQVIGRRARIPVNNSSAGRARFRL